MDIIGKVYLMFEQSGVFKNEFKKLGYEAEDYDIQNNFGETDNVVDLFTEIENAYDGKNSLFDNIGSGDLIMAFFPCIYFSSNNTLHFDGSWITYHQRKMTELEINEAILERGRQSPAQVEWQSKVEQQGYRYEVIRSLEEFKKLIKEYLEL